MYTQFFKLKEKPFNLSPKASIFHDNEGISPAYQDLLKGVLAGEKLIVLTGDTGTGKTLCAQKLLADLEHDPKYCGITLPFTSLPFDEMLGYICAELDLSFGLGQNDDKLEILEMFLTHGLSAIRSIVIVIDEAQNLAPGIFDELIKLLKIGEGAKRSIQIVVMARNESDLKLHHPHMATFSQHISRRCHLHALTPSETTSYIKYQLEVAGAAYSDFFTGDAAEKVYDLTQGRARAINILCDHTLIVAANENETIITVDHVNNAHRQQKFDDTIEMRTSLISDAIDRFVNGREPDSIVTPETVPEPETIEPVISESVVNIEPAPTIYDPQKLPFSQDEKETIPTVHHDQKSGGGFWKVALGSLAVLSIASLIYSQIQQQKIISDLEGQLSAVDGSNTTPETEIATELLRSDDKPDFNIVDHEQKIETAEPAIKPVIETPENETVYLEDQPIPDHSSDQGVQKQAMNEDNNVVQIKKSENTVTPSVPETSEPEISPDPLIEEAPFSVTEQLLSIAELQISELKLTNPQGDNALESYKQILEIDLENVQAREGIASIKEMFLGWAENNISSNKPDRARQYYEKALLVDPEDLEIPAKIAELDELNNEPESNEIKSGLLGLAREGNAKDIETLLDKGAYADIQDQRGNTPLMLATDRGHVDVVLTLLKYGANSNQKNKAGDTALINAVWNNQIKIADLLIRNKAKINAANNRGWTSLMYAAIHGHTDLFKKLIDSGANLESQTDDRKTSLSIAAHNGKRGIVSQLLENGAKVNTKDRDGWTPLMHAVWNNHPTVVQALLLNKSKINHRNKEGWSSLMLAAWNGDDAIVKMLLQQGANKTIKNKDGNMAFDLASEQQHYSVVALLR